MPPQRTMIFLRLTISKRRQRPSENGLRADLGPRIPTLIATKPPPSLELHPAATTILTTPATTIATRETAAKRNLTANRAATTAAAAEVDPATVETVAATITEEAEEAEETADDDAVDETTIAVADETTAPKMETEDGVVAASGIMSRSNLMMLNWNQALACWRCIPTDTDFCATPPITILASEAIRLSQGR